MNCTICTGKLRDPFELSCGHIYCKPCIATWFHVGRGCNRACPICKALIREKLPTMHIEINIAPFPGRVLSFGSPTSSTTTSSLTPSPRTLSTSPNETRLSMRLVPGRSLVEVRESRNRCISRFCIPVKLLVCYWTGYLVLNVILQLRMRGISAHIFFLAQGGAVYSLCRICHDAGRNCDTNRIDVAPDLDL